MDINCFTKCSVLRFGLNCTPSKTLKSLLLVPVNMTLFGNGVFADDEVKMGSGRVGHREHAM